MHRCSMALANLYNHMKVGHITDSLNFGGAEQWLLNLAEISRDRNLSNFDTVILTAHEANGREICHVRCSCRSPAIGKIDLRSWRMGIMDVIAERKLPICTVTKTVCRLAVVGHRGANIEDFAHSQFTDCHLLHEFFSEAKRTMLL